VSQDFLALFFHQTIFSGLIRDRPKNDFGFHGIFVDFIPVHHPFPVYSPGGGEREGVETL
jgi:hypothetical protein